MTAGASPPIRWSPTRRTRRGRGAPTQAVKASAQAAKEPEDPLAASGKLQKVDAIGNVSIRTATETVTGDRAVYVPDTGIARVAAMSGSPEARTSSTARKPK